ncbi:ATP-binding protein [Streptosporangium sp. NPDC051023]|uniref:ATP-binding protein n=1 Tax=Streptosporangium sp. NPDC051023 TaxID=3155410 RepID=UPI00344ECDC6
MIPPQTRWDIADGWHRTFPGTREQVRQARHFVRAHLPCHPDAELIASELAINAVEHTRIGEPGGTFTALIHPRPDGTAYLAIKDQGGPALFGLPTSDHEGGRGLHLVEALTTAWGVKGDATGRTVWAELSPPAP